MRKVIDRAERTRDRRLAGLRKAMLEGKAEDHLRLLGIISEVDIRREFQGMER
jgi:hypothetical protein